jgi:glycosyltransferase involved in cell wall biosynthesis
MSRRILHVVRSLSRETGGLATFVRAVVPAMTAAGHRVTTLSLGSAVAGDADVVTLGAGESGYGFRSSYVPWLAAHRSEFDAVVVHGLWQYQGLGARRALASTGTPYLVYPHGMLDPWFKRAYPLKHAKKWCYWPWGEYPVLRDAAAVCFTSEEERRSARDSFWFYRARERVTPLGIAPPPAESERQRLAFGAAHPELAGSPFLLYLGRVHPKKGIEELLEAHAQISRGRAGAPALAVAGPCSDPGYGARLRRRAAKLQPAGAVHWLPMLSGDLKWGALRSCEGFVLLSHQENFGLAVVEALACGRPVLISDRVNIWREIVADGAGLAAKDTVAGGAELIGRWLDLDGDGRAAMGRAAESCFRERFTIERAAQSLIAAVDEAMAGSVPLAKGP